jgi:REP element-mobilizing transposase RayT
MYAGVFHVYTHCVWANPNHFEDDTDRMVFLRELARVTVGTEWTCITYCLMRSHYHLIVQVEDGVIPVAMQSLNWRYAVHYNLRHAMRGTTLATRYGARRIHDESGLLACFKYVVLNPVDAGLCERPQDWAWSSYASTVDLADPQPFIDDRLILACFDAPSREHSIAQLRRYVEGA